MALVQIPLSSGAQSFTVDLGGRPFRMAFAFVDETEGSWTLDIGDANGAPLVCGIPLLPEQDLLEPYAYLSIGGSLFIDCAGELDGVPTFEGLGTRTLMFFGTPQQSDGLTGLAAFR